MDNKTVKRIRALYRATNNLSIQVLALSSKLGDVQAELLSILQGESALEVGEQLEIQSEGEE